MPALQHGIQCKGIIFDKDGTLIDSLQIWPELIQCRIAVLQRYIGFSDEYVPVLEKYMGLSQGKVILRSPIVIASPEQTASSVAAGLYYHLSIPWDEAITSVQKAYAESDAHFPLEDRAIPVAGAKELLARLKTAGFAIAVATNDVRKKTETIMKLAGLHAGIDVYACRDEVATGKPAADTALLACRRLELAPSQCIVVGDSLFDIDMGKNAGVKATVGVLTGASRREDLLARADYIINSIADLL